MWIHLLPLGLIDGASSSAEPVLTDTHDGWWAKKWKKKRKPETLAEAERQIEEVRAEIAEVKQAVSVPRVDTRPTAPDRKLDLLIAYLEELKALQIQLEEEELLLL